MTLDDVNSRIKRQSDPEIFANIEFHYEVESVNIELLEEIVETTNEIVLAEAENVLTPSLTVEALAAANHFDLTENSGKVVKTIKKYNYSSHLSKI